VKGVRFALASYVDIHGKLKAKCVPIAHLNDMLLGSELFTGAALDGVPQQVSDNELAAVPDPTSCIQLPWKPELAWFASDLHLAGKSFEACSRNILKRQLEVYDEVVAKKAAENALFKEIVESQLAFAKRTTQWEQDTVVSRKMAFDHYWGANAKPVKL